MFLNLRAFNLYGFVISSIARVSAAGETMADIKAGEPFGLDRAAQDEIHWDLALKRITHDLRSDFIYAPHLSYIYNRAGDQLIGLLSKT
jgi:hypothetical protein